MDHNQEEKIKRTLDFIEKDRNIPDDPWFYSRLIARMENQEEKKRAMGFIGTIAQRLRPVLALAVIVVGITGGIYLGRALSPPVSSQESAISVFITSEDASAVLFREISGSMDEQILLMR